MMTRRIDRWSSLSAAAGLAAAAVLLGVPSGTVGAATDAETCEQAFDRVLAAVVEDGWVDYAQLQSDPGPLDAWLQTVETMPLRDVESWPSDFVIAFYINAYNGHALRIVRDRYPIEGANPAFPSSSIQQIPAVWSLPLIVAGRHLSLDAIEKDVLIGELDAPRTHMALVCASVGCPPLKNEAYHGGRLLEELNLASQSFLRSPRGAQLDLERKVLRLSPIFDWYEEDFRKFGTTSPAVAEVFGERAGMIQFVGSFLRDEERAFIRRADFRIEFFAYDWTLNDLRNRP